MADSPDTRPSLILRLRDPQDALAWSEFAEVYEPLVYRWARSMSMQDADAREATQEVMLRLARAVDMWKPDSQGSFRGWLYRVARNIMLRHLEGLRRHPKGSGDTAQVRMLHEMAASDEGSAVFDTEFRRHVFAWATQKIRPDFEPLTWDAFWSTFVEQQSISDVSEHLGCSKGAVYIARSRVMKRLRETVQRQLDQDWADIPQQDEEASA